MSFIKEIIRDSRKISARARSEVEKDILINPNTVPEGSSIKAVLLQGKIISTVVNKKQYNESESELQESL